MSKVGYTDQNRLDPQWAPSDAEMINWLEKNRFAVGTDETVDSVWWLVVSSDIEDIREIGNGATWRAAVEDAMRKENRDI